MRIAVLFDGAGLARLGLEQAGHDCTGFELDPTKHALSVHIGSGQCVLADATGVNLRGFDAIWASPPCQDRSPARNRERVQPPSPYAGNYLEWCLSLPHRVLWVENVPARVKVLDAWGVLYNANQFLETPVQNRTRLVGGRYAPPRVHRPYNRFIAGVCPAITATEYKASKNDKRRACRFYGRKLTIEECAYHMGFTIPAAWYQPPPGFTQAAWRQNIYQAIGNGVPVYMARGFGEVYTKGLHT